MGMAMLKGEGKSTIVTSYCLDHTNSTIVYLGFLARERSVVGALASDLMLGKDDIQLVNDKLIYSLKKGNITYTCVYSKIEMGKDSYVHCVMYPSTYSNENVFVIDNQNKDGLYEGIYSKLMELYDLPLLRRWSRAIADKLIDENYIHIRPLVSCVDERKLKDQSFVYVSDELTNEVFDELISSMIKEGTISFNNPLIGNLDIATIDQFYIKYGQQIMEPVINSINPLLPDPKPTLQVISMKKTPFPQQAYIVNATSEYFKHRMNKVLLMIEEMGCGKSFQSIMAAEQTMLQKYMRQHPKVSREDALKNLSYRAIIMSPGHILKKWRKEIVCEIPNSKAIIIDTRKRLIQLMDERGKKPDGRVFYIMSKDFAKLSYMEGPAPVREGIRPSKVTECDNCGRSYPQNMHKKKCSECNGIILTRVNGYKKGVICPECNNVITNIKSGEAKRLGDFDRKRKSNAKCSECGTSLWTPYVENLGETKEKLWDKVKVFKNRARKKTMSIWMHKEDDIISDGRELAGYAKVNGIRKFAPSTFIKKKLGKNFFDIAIVDELHQYKGGATAQAQAMHSITACSRKIIGMTGTLAGGYANDLFYMFWRLIPHKMVQNGFCYSSELDFASTYGCVEERILIDGDDAYNSSSRGHSTARIKVKPGISALIYTDFMMANTVYLSINDLSSFMPPYLEYIVPVDMHVDVTDAYNMLERDFMTVIRGRGPDSRRIISNMLQTLLAYPDKPYGMEDILSPTMGRPIVSVPDLSEYSDISCLLPKEEKLVEIINQEIEENRNCFIYVEFTGDPQKYVVKKLVNILEKCCNLEGQVAVLKSSSPAANKREEWIHKNAYAGKRVFITHPRCVETGLECDAFLVEKTRHKVA